MPKALPKREKYFYKDAKQKHLTWRSFCEVTIDGERIEHDVLIRLCGAAAKRKKRLSKALIGMFYVTC